jgi:hypothetical protein
VTKCDNDRTWIMNTIEPRLIALLNTDVFLDPKSPSNSLDLPPLQDPNILKASGRPILLEPDASTRTGTPQHANLVSATEEDSKRHKCLDGKKEVAPIVGRTLGNSSPQSLRKILDDDTGNTTSLISKKRSMVDSGKDDFVQLPQPPKKQKAAKQVVPPIIIGLFEPPPQAALFPPIASSSFHDSHGSNIINMPPKPQEVQEKTNAEETVEPVVKKSDSSKDNPKKTRKDVKARKKWTEEETNNLLLGVAKHGVGRWTSIVEDPTFLFNGRSGVDLKDRFRTCCPAELRGKVPQPKVPPGPVDGAAKKSTSGLMSENILIDEDDLRTKESGSDTKPNKERKTRAHRKKIEDLIQLGIQEPFRTSQRRERRVFTEEDDREILLGYQIYGPAWSRIQRDSRFHLQSRQATDLRDRFRNKYPDKFRLEDSSSTDTPKLDEIPTPAPTVTPTATTFQSASSREGLRIHHIISENDDTVPRVHGSQPQASGSNFKENFTSYSDRHTEVDDGLPSFDWNGNAPFTSNIGEMDISRLLLDEPWMENPSSKERPSFTDINSILSSNTDDGLNHVSSYYDMLVNNDPINLSSSVTLDQDTSF